MIGYLFVYGTLRLGSPHPLARRLARSAEHVGIGTIPGVLYDFGPFPGAILDERGGEIVGDVFALTGSAPLLTSLDRYEGVSTGGAASFRRQEAIVTLAPRQRLEAWVYVLTRAPGARRIAGGDWLSHRKLRSALRIVAPGRIR